MAKSTCSTNDTKSGVRDFMHKKITTIFLTPFIIWFVWSILFIVKNPDRVGEWIACPWTMFLSIFFTGNILYHGYLETKTIVEDYVHCSKMKNLLILLLFTLCMLTFIGSCVTFFGLHFTYLIRSI